MAIRPFCMYKMQNFAVVDNAQLTVIPLPRRLFFVALVAGSVRPGVASIATAVAVFTGAFVGFASVNSTESFFVCNSNVIGSMSFETSKQNKKETWKKAYRNGRHDPCSTQYLPLLSWYCGRCTAVLPFFMRQILTVSVENFHGVNSGFEGEGCACA